MQEESVFKPEFSGALLGWTKNYIKRNKWRVMGYLEFEDLLQEAHLRFFLCVKKYPDVENPQHFFSLYRTAFINRFKELSAVKGDEIPEDPQTFPFEVRAGRAAHLGDLAHRLHKAPKEVKSVLLAMTADDNKNVRARKLQKFKHDGLSLKEGGLRNRETTNEYLCSLVGLDPNEINLHKILLDFVRDE